jgi:hypothetical protein
MCYSGCLHSYLLLTVPELKKHKFQIKQSVGCRFVKPPAVPAFCFQSREKSCCTALILYVYSSEKFFCHVS